MIFFVNILWSGLILHWRSVFLDLKCRSICYIFSQNLFHFLAKFVDVLSFEKIIIKSRLHCTNHVMGHAKSSDFLKKTGVLLLFFEGSFSMVLFVKFSLWLTLFLAFETSFSIIFSSTPIFLKNVLQYCVRIRVSGILPIDLNMSLFISIIFLGSDISFNLEIRIL